MAAESDPLLRVGLHDRVAQQLREMIIVGDLEPGERIPERDLCGKLGISRTPLREALKILSTECLVQLLPYRGAVVTKLTEKQRQDIFLVIMGLEQIAAELACAHITKEQLERIEALHQEMQENFRKGDRLSYFRNNIAIHELIVEASDNDPLLQTYRSLNNRIMRPRYLSNLHPSQWKESMRQHEKILKALRSRKGDRLVAALREHYISDSEDWGAPAVRL